MTLSVIVISYNTEDLTKKSLEAIQASLNSSPSIDYEIIIVDNNSSDGSVAMLEGLANKDHKIKLIKNHTNVGFGAGNNIGIKKAQGKYVLLLNSDVIADSVDFEDLISYLDKDVNIGALTVRVELPSGSIDPASHRGFPTIWHSLCYFLKLEKLFGRLPILSRFFGGYHLTFLDLHTIHEIDSPAAAFYLTRRSILNEIYGFDESYFMYGEDVDLSYRLKQKGYSIIYYPKFTVLHLKGQSGINKQNNSSQRKETKKHFYDAMKIFYRTHYAPKNSALINSLVYAGIDFKSKL